MNDDLLAALREGIRSGSVPQPISGESIDDYRFRTAHAGAIIGIKWAQGLAEAIAVAQFEADAAEAEADVDVPDSPAELVDLPVRDWRQSGTSVVPQDTVSPGPRRPLDSVGIPPEQNESAGV